MTEFNHLVGGVKGPARYADGFPPISFDSAGKFSGTTRRAFPRVCTPAFQASAGTCYPHTALGVVQSDALHRVGADVNLSILDTYYGARRLEGNGAEKVDGGCYTDEIVRFLREYGTVSESRRPYNPNLVTTWEPPNDQGWIDDRKLNAPDFQLIPVAADPILAELEAGRCVGITLLVYGQMTSNPPDGIIRGPDGGPVLGGHAMFVVGFDLDQVNPPGLGVGGLWLRNHWRGYGLRHPLQATDSRFAAHVESYSYVPLSLLSAPRFIMDAIRLAKPIQVRP